MSQTTPAPAPEAAKAWEMPSGDQEFVFENVASAPEWVDKGWASFDRGPALALPAGDLYGKGPYHTKIARVGDKVLFVAAVGSTPAHFEVVAKEPDPETMGTKKPPQQSAASVEDMLKLGYMTPDDLGEDAKAEIVSRSPELKRMVEEGEGVPEPQSIAAVLKTD